MTEIEVEDLGTMRPLNIYQLDRLKRMRACPNKEIAFMAFSLGLTVHQFKKLPPDLQSAARRAHDTLHAPTPIPPIEAHQRPRMPAKGEHVSLDQQIILGRQLLQVKARLPRGHFVPWLNEKSGVSNIQAQRWMKAAKNAEATNKAEAA